MATYNGNSLPANIAYINGDIINFEYVGSRREIKLSAGAYIFECWGAAGGRARTTNTNTMHDNVGGSYTKGLLQIRNDYIFYIFVGERGADHPYNSGGRGGWNGGGTGGYDTDAVGTVNPPTDGRFKEAGSGGGGATDIRLFNNTTWNNANGLRSRIMVAAGSSGGGAGARMGFPGGTLNGDGNSAHSVIPTQNSGNFGFGGAGFIETNSTRNRDGAPGHGGGYYAGLDLASYVSSSTTTAMRGSGGSCFISGHPGCNAVESDSSGVHTNQPNHYSGLIFKETQMISGSASKPNPRDVGNITDIFNHGYARITVLNIYKTLIEVDKVLRAYDGEKWVVVS